MTTVTKSPEESAKAKAKREEAQALKRKRREEQEANVAKKQEVKDAKKQRRLDRKQQREDGKGPGGDKDDDSELDDAEYYRQEVGEEPDTYMFPDAKKQKAAAKAKDAASTKQEQKPGQMAPSDKARRFFKAAAPKGKVVRQRQPKK